MIAAWCALAAAAPGPRGEVFMGVSGSLGQGYGLLVAQPALVRGRDASLLLRASVSHLRYSYTDGSVHNDVDAPGVSFGPAFVYRPGPFSLGFAVGLGGRVSFRRADGALAQRSTYLEATFSGDLGWRPGDRAQTYGLFSFSAGDRYLWARLGGSVQLPLRGRLAPWVGAEATTGGTFEARSVELGPVVEIPLRALGASLSVRGGVSLVHEAGDASLRPAPSLGFGAYWAY